MKQWIITFAGYPLAMSNAGTEARCKAVFIKDYERPWKEARECGYDCVRFTLIHTKPRKARP